jgi:hypothetical protein
MTKPFGWFGNDPRPAARSQVRHRAGVRREGPLRSSRAVATYTSNRTPCASGSAREWLTVFVARRM